ncbi:uncharacterized protein PRCAT00003019001 [Priceomyces carsonii]|uniref:uncharacterized protein n=1 Tax=Priceomyces carsonii TaxID=28549 RepID=UPI002ED83BF8|nr:unnamed protein product [Priceomyces carsonii]
MLHLDDYHGPNAEETTPLIQNLTHSQHDPIRLPKSVSTSKMMNLPNSVQFKERQFKERLPASADKATDNEYWKRDNGSYWQDRRYSISSADLLRLNSSHKPLYQRLLSSQFSVTNPNSVTDQGGNNSNFNFAPGILDNGSVCSLDLEEQSRRLAIMNSMRPHRLIGKYITVADWDKGYVDISCVKKLKLKKYYEDQNYLIERFKEIDAFLDAGKIHLNMLSNYGTPNYSLDHDIDEAEIESSDCESYQRNLTVNSKHSRFNEIPGNIGYEGAQFLGYNEEKNNSEVLVAILVNFFINILLLVGKIIVTIMTRSMSMIASLVDSILDFFSTFIIFIANKLSTTKNWRVEHSYPIGRSRLEPLGVLIFSVIIILSFFQVGQESFKRLLSPPESREIARIGTQAIFIMCFTIIAKVACWLWCSKSKSSSVQALAQDAMTDIVFNTVSLLMPTVGYMFDIWWLDPLGALLLSIYIISSWCKTAFEHIDNLTGAVASPLDYKVILYLAYRFAESIKLITSLKVYHVGDNLNVEIDVVFDSEEFNLSLKDCHDIAEALQYAIESLPMVERAFVHIDYMEGNYKGHLK